jgi:FdrA protein
MSLRSRRYPNLYKDSVSLMTVSAKLTATPGVERASVVMATPANIENLARAGLGEYEARANDLLIAVLGSDEGCEVALQLADELLSAKAAAAGNGEAAAEQPLTSIQMAVAQDPSLNLALISVPGDYAAAEAMKALRLGLDVMLFSDNVTVERELALKLYARERDLMVMGPDCGTAIVGGVPLGFANAVRRGAIGVVGASGTGTQEVTVRIHRLGQGISHALGTGGHDLSAKIGGISMLHGLAALDADPATKVIVLVSKPPAPEVAERVLAAAERSAKPVVVIFLGADPAAIKGKGVYGARSLAEAADMAVSLAKGGEAPAAPVALSDEAQRTFEGIARAMAASQRYVRGVFSGGTFCYEAQLVHAAAGVRAFSNTPIEGNLLLKNSAKSFENAIIDMGDDEFTRGRPHPMIDPSQRNARIGEEIADPETAVVLFDVVLGYGASAEPTSGLIGVVGAARAAAKAAGRQVALVAHACGTDLDPQNRDSVVAALKCAGVFVVSSNAEAAAWSAAIVVARSGTRP